MTTSFEISETNIDIGQKSKAMSIKEVWNVMGFDAVFKGTEVRRFCTKAKELGFNDGSYIDILIKIQGVRSKGDCAYLHERWVYENNGVRIFELKLMPIGTGRIFVTNP
jgi:hypothetical protein